MRRWLTVAACIAALSTIGHTQASLLVSIVFDDAPPPLFIDDAGSATMDRSDFFWSASACSTGGVGWTDALIAAAPGNGCYGDAACTRVTMCDFAVSDVGDCDNNPVGETSTECDDPGDGAYRQLTWSAGYSASRMMDPPAAGWIASGSPWYGRVRILPETAIGYSGVTVDGVASDSHHQMKWFIWHADVFDGDDRVMGFLESGNNCGSTELAVVCFTLQRNINHLTQSATVQLTIGSWNNIQFSWQHGASAFVKIWNNHTDIGTPTASDVSFGETWNFDAAGYNSPIIIGAVSNAGTRFDGEFRYKVQNFQIDDEFDADWGEAEAAGSLPVRLRFRVLP